MSQGERKGSITTLRKWNLTAGGIDPRNDVIPASVGYGLEDALDFAMSEILRLQDRIKRLEEGILKNNQEIEQTCGKVLGYPWFKDDQKNFPGSTEKDGVCVGDHVAETIVSELASRYTEVLARIKRLEEAGDAMAAIIGPPGSAHWADENQVDAAWNNWAKAKEAKP